MAALFLGSFLALAGFLVHVAIWRRRRPRSSGSSLIKIFISTIATGTIVAAAAFFVFPSARAGLPAHLGDWIQAVTLALALAAAYVLTYPAIEVESPTLLLAELFDATGAQGLTRSELHRRLGNDVLVRPRVQDMLDEKLVELSGPRYLLTPKGRALGALFVAWRTCLRASRGG